MQETHYYPFGLTMATSVRNIIDDCDNKSAIKEAISALKPGPWKTELAAANTLFSEKYLDRAQETGAATPENIKIKRSEANKAQAWQD